MQVSLLLELHICALDQIAYGVIGQIILVEKKVSKVLLIYDIKSAIPAMIGRLLERR